MRPFALSLAAVLTTSVLLAEAQVGYKAEVTIQVPKDVKFEQAKMPGGETAVFDVLVKIKNAGDVPMPFSRQDLKFRVLDAEGKTLQQPTGWSWDRPKTADPRPIEPGAGYEGKETFHFSAGVPAVGARLTVVLELDGQQAAGTFTVKN